MKCVHCQQQVNGFFTVTRVDADGIEKGSVHVCSALCLVQWSYQYLISRGVEGVVTVADAIKRVQNMIRPPRGKKG